MASTPELTVVVLTYNSASTIGACLQSLTQQEWKDFEVVIVDDDSTDGTLAVVAEFAVNLVVSVVRNGSHNIPRGRNIGMRHARAGIVAFVDSDDYPALDWTRIIIETFRAEPGLALVSGDMLPAFHTKVGQAIALNDEAVRRLFWRGFVHFAAGNSAINRTVMNDEMFDEEFRFAEDLELVTRVKERYRWAHVPNLKVHHYSRDTFAEYAKQMYSYGFMKLRVSFRSQWYSWPDFVPLGVLVGGGLLSLARRSSWFLFIIIPFSLLEAVFVAIFRRCTPKVAFLTFPAWLIKNLSWSGGICHSMVSLALDHDARRLLRSPPARSS